MSSSEFLSKGHFDPPDVKSLYANVRKARRGWRRKVVIVGPVPPVAALVRSFREEDVILKETRRRARR